MPVTATKSELPEVLRFAKFLLSSYMDAAILTDAALKPLHYNIPYQIMTGMGRRALGHAFSKCRTAFDIIGDAETEARAREALTSGLPCRLAEAPLVLAGGGEMVVVMAFIPVIDSDGRPHGVLASFRDVTAEARVQQRYKDLLANARSRADEFERLVQVRTAELAQALEEVTRLSETDPLTGLLNRRSFHERARVALAAVKRYQRTLALVMCDIDHFKRINDLYGHDVGDEALKAVAAALRQAVRETDIVARFGGEEFIVLLSETQGQEAVRTAERLNAEVQEAAVETLSALSGTRITMSSGVALFPQHGETLELLVKHADEALYTAKAKGRNRAVICSTLEGANR